MPPRDGKVALSSSSVRLIRPSTPPQFGQRWRRRVAKVQARPYRAIIDDLEDHHKCLGWRITRPSVPGLSCYHHRDKPTQSPALPLCVSTPIHISSQTGRTKNGWALVGWAYLAITERKVWTQSKLQQLIIHR